MPVKSLKKQIQKYAAEIEAYRTHSLFDEARQRCKELIKLIKQSGQLKNQVKLLAFAEKKT